MTIQDNTPWEQTVSAGSSNIAFGFLIYNSSDMNLFVDGVATSEFTIIAAAGGANAGLSPDTGGQVQMTTASTSGSVLTVFRNLARERTTNFQPGGNINIPTLNDQLDRQVAFQAEDVFDLSRTIHMAPFDTDIASTGMELPDAADRAGLVLAFTSTGAVTAVVGSTQVTVGDLGDVDLSGPANNDLIVFETGSTAWIDRTFTSTTLISVTHSTDDVVIGFDVSTGTTGQMPTITATGVAWAGVSAVAELDFSARNVSGDVISRGQPVFASGFHAGSTSVQIDLAQADDTATMPCIGLVESTEIANNAIGLISESGLLSDLDTSTSTVDDLLYVSATGPGVLTAVKPAGANLIQRVGQVLRSHASQGQILIFGAGRANDTPNVLTHDLDVGTGNAITSTGSTDIVITPDSTGQVILDGQYWPQAIGTTGQILSVDSTSQLAWLSMQAAIEATPVDFLDINQQAASPSTPAAGDVSLWFTDDTVPRPQYTVPGPTDFGMLRFEPATAVQALWSGVGSRTDMTCDINGAPAGQVVTYDTTVNEDALDIMDGSDGKVWIHNITQGETRMVTPGGFDTGANTMTFHAGEDITAWADGDSLRLAAAQDLDAGIPGTRAFAISLEDIVPIGTVLVLVTERQQDSGTITATGAPLVGPWWPTNNETLRWKASVSGINAIQFSLYEVDQANNYSIFGEILGTGAGTITTSNIIMGWFIQ